jgi:hypothetical protein
LEATTSNERSKNVRTFPTTLNTDRELADAVWLALESLDMVDGIDGGEYRFRLLGQSDEQWFDEPTDWTKDEDGRLKTPLPEGPDSQVSRWATAMRLLLTLLAHDEDSLRSLLNEYRERSAQLGAASPSAD